MKTSRVSQQVWRGLRGRTPRALSLLESARNRGLWRNAKETRHLWKAKAESFQFSVKNSHCSYIRTKGGWRVKLGNAEALEHLWRQGSKTSTRTDPGREIRAPQLELMGNPATETLQFSCKGPSHWPSLGHVWKQGLASCLNTYLCVHAQSCLTLCNPMDCSPPTSSVHGISRPEYWSGLPFPSPGDLPNPGIESQYKDLHF